MLIMSGKILWIVGAVCAIAYIVGIVVGERVDGLGMVGFVLIVFGLVIDHNIGDQANPPRA
jgi:hypothetical protein